MARVFVTRPLPGSALIRLQESHEVVVHPGPQPPTRQQLEHGFATADGVLTLLTDKVDADLLDRAPHLTTIANYAVGSDNIDLQAATGRDIQVGTTPDVLTDATADLAFALLLAVARHIVPANRSVHDGTWGAWGPSDWLGAPVAGATLAIIGAGRIGNAVAQRGQGFGMRTLTVGRDDDLHARLNEADFVSVNVPLTDATTHLIDQPALRAMRPTAYLVNTARGKVVDQHALRTALIDGWIAGAALDVTDPEPLPPTDPLLQAPNLLVTPHIGSATTQARERMADMAVDNLIAGLRGDPLPHSA